MTRPGRWRLQGPELPRVLAFLLGLMLLLGGQPPVSLAATPGPPSVPARPMAPDLHVPRDQPNLPDSGAVVEILRLKVPAALRAAWREAERGSWEPWLQQQPGFVDRQLFWDPVREEATLLIRWANRAAWKAIPAEEVERVQDAFEALARERTGQTRGNPFPLVFEGELVPQ
jgi:uncharacterized protein (TIGR03792 family)